MSSAFYRSREWRQLRAECLRRQPTCSTPGCVARSVVADHIKPRSKGGADALHNLRGLCIQCHNQRRQGGEPRAWCDAEGRPMAPGHWWNRENVSGLGGNTVWEARKTVSFEPTLSEDDRHGS